MKKRVVVTGMGTINPLADNLDDYYKALMAGKSGIGKWSSIDMSLVECKIGGDLGHYDTKGALEGYKDYLGQEHFKMIRRLFRYTTFSAKLAILTSLAAWKDANLSINDTNPLDTGIVVAGHNLNSNYMFEVTKQFLQDPEWMDALAGVEAIDPNVPGIVAEALNLKGPSFTIGGACASGNLAMREGFREIVMGESVRSVICGPPFDVSPADIHASAIINAVVIRRDYQDRPEEASRPFDVDRCGFLYSHGAGTIVLEELETALERAAPIYGEVLGIKAGSNANHLPMPGAENQTRIMRDLLNIANIEPEEVDYVNCHATGTASGDLQEVLAIQAAFGEHAKNLKVNAPKSMLGHTCWASPLVETIGGLLQMKYGYLHPSTNIKELDPAINLNVITQAEKHQINIMLKNSFGFGGINCCSLIGRYGGNK